MRLRGERFRGEVGEEGGLESWVAKRAFFTAVLGGGVLWWKLGRSPLKEE